METSPEETYRDLVAEDSRVAGPVENPIAESGGTEDEFEETVARRRIGNPQLPSPEEVEEHRIDHLPYRVWCRHCVEGPALGERPSGSQLRARGRDRWY